MNWFGFYATVYPYHLYDNRLFHNQLHQHIILFFTISTTYYDNKTNGDISISAEKINPFQFGAVRKTHICICYITKRIQGTTNSQNDALPYS